MTFTATINHTPLEQHVHHHIAGLLARLSRSCVKELIAIKQLMPVKIKF